MLQAVWNTLRHNVWTSRPLALFFDRAVGVRLNPENYAEQRENHLSDYAERVVWFTQGYTDPVELRAELDRLILPDRFNLTAKEVIAYLDRHLEDLPLHSAGERRQQFLTTTRSMLSRGVFTQALRNGPQGPAETETPHP